uniref:phosphotransferase n=1 Tax=Nonomuraea lactucae TaxID=2249762 RepID=UPI0013B44568
MNRHDFFADPDLVRPEVSAALAGIVAARHFGLDGEIREVGSEQDRNFVIDAPAGRFLLKVSNPAYSDDELAAQVAGVAHLAGAVPELRFPEPRPSLNGGFTVRFAPDGGAGAASSEAEPLRARVFSFVPGFPLIDSPYLAPAVVGRLGTVAARVCAGLADFRHPGLDRLTQWDVRNARQVCDALAGSLTGHDHVDRDRAELLRRAVGEACDRLDALSPSLRVQAIHGDLTDDNVVCERGVDGRPDPTGVIDFGDLGFGWVVAELATACACVLHHDPARPLAVLAAVRAFHEVVALSEAEVAALWPAIVARAAVLVTSGVHQARIDPANAYVLDRQQAEWRAFEAAAGLPFEVAHRAVRDALGLPGPP